MMAVQTFEPIHSKRNVLSLLKKPFYLTLHSKLNTDSKKTTSHPTYVHFSKQKSKHSGSHKIRRLIHSQVSKCHYIKTTQLMIGVPLILKLKVVSTSHIKPMLF